LNKGTVLRTIARVAFSIYTAFCMWQVSIGELGKLLDAPWLAIAVAVVIVICGMIVDVITTYFNNDYTEVAAQHTAEMRQHKEELKEGYIGDTFFANDIPDEYDEEEGEKNEQ